MKKTAPWLIPFIQKIKDSPELYLGSGNIHAFYLYIQGQQDARISLGFERFGEGEEKFLEDFSKWLEGKFGRVNGGWYTHVVIQGKSDDNVRTFVKLLREFAKDSDEYRYIFET